MAIRCIGALVLCALWFAATPNLSAERKYVIGTKLDLVGGASSYASVSGLDFQNLPTGFSPFYSTYPSIELRSTGEKSTLEMSYTFGLYRVRTSQDIGSESHAVTANFDTKLGERWRFKLTESFQRAPDFTTFNALTGLAVTSQGFSYIYSPVLVRRSSLTNQATGNLSYELNPESSLSFGFSHGLRDYADDPAFRGRLSDQNRIEGNAIYVRKVSKHGSWNVKYAFLRNQFKDFGDANTHNMSVGYSHQLRPTLTLSFDAGPSYTFGIPSQNQSNYLGYNVYLSLVKSIRSNRLSLYYTHRSGDSSGLQSISDSHSAGFGILHPIGRRIAVTLNAAAYESRQRLEGSQRDRGISGSADVSVALSRYLSLSGGAGYQKREGLQILDVEQKQVYLALRVHAPEMWRFAR